MSNRVDHPQDKLNALAIAEANGSSKLLSWCLHDDGTMTIVTSDKGKIERQPILTRVSFDPAKDAGQDGSQAPGVSTPGATHQQHRPDALTGEPAKPTTPAARTRRK